ncbi:MAG: outer membrane beta-barrel protein [Acidobacteriota bacterium]
MIKLIPGFLLLIFLSSTVTAQDVPKVEIFGGYARLFSEDEGNISFTSADSFNGFSVAVTYNFSKSIGLVSEISGLYSRETNVTIDFINKAVFRDSASINTYTFLQGLRYSFRKNLRVTPFAHALIGAYRASFDVRLRDRSDNLFNRLLFSFSESSLATALGGGVDININKRFSVRALQVDYLFLRKQLKASNTRLVTGLVVKF